MKNMVLFLPVLLFFTFSAPQTSSVFCPRLNYAESSSTIGSASEMAKQKRLWFYVTSSFFNNLNGEKMVQSFVSNEVAYDLFPVVMFTSCLGYCDVPTDTTSYSYCVVSGGTSITARARVSYSRGGDSSYLHLIDGTNMLDSLQKPIAFSSELLTASLVNLILEGYQLNLSDVSNGYGAYPLLLNNVLNNFSGSDEDLREQFHKTIGPEGNVITISSYEKIEALRKEYNSSNHSLADFGGIIGLFSAIFVLFVSFCFLFPVLFKKILPFWKRHRL